MAKLTPILIGTSSIVTVSTVCVTCAATLGGSTAPKIPPKPPGPVFTSVDEFKKDPKTNPCVSEYFGEDFAVDETGVDLASGVQSNAFDNKLFKNPQDGNFNPNASCLIVNWSKETYDTKWKGTFNWVWTFVRGDEGFINFNMAEITKQQKLKFTGTFYLLEKVEDKWKTTYKKEIKESTQDIDKNLFDSRFPKVGTALSSLNPKSYWGFVNSSADVDNICKEEECSEEATKTNFAQQFNWTPNKSASTLLKDWAEQMKWWNNIYSITKWNIEAKIQEFKGTWAKA